MNANRYSNEELQIKLLLSPHSLLLANRFLLAPQPEEGEKEVTKVKKTKSKKSEKDAGDAPARSPSKKRAQRSGSNVFAMFTQHQVAQFKEAFQFIDSDKDGIISKNDIRATFDALGRLCTDKELEEMASEAPVSIELPFNCYENVAHQGLILIELELTRIQLVDTHT